MNEFVLDKKKIRTRRNVWFDDKLWRVTSVRGKTVTLVDKASGTVRVVDIFNEEVYPNTADVRRLMNEQSGSKDKELIVAWLSLFIEKKGDSK